MTQKMDSRTINMPAAFALLLISAVALDVQYAILTPLVGIIQAQSGLTSTEVGWVLNSMMLGSVISIGLITRLGDTYGHRKVLLVVLALAMAGSLLADVVPGFWPLMIGRFAMGFAVAIPLSWGLLRPRATARQVRLVSVALATVMAIFTPLAIVMGGFVVSVGGPWETVFWVIFAITAVLFLLALAAPETPPSARARQDVDWLGAIGIGVWVTALLIAISEGPVQGWMSPLVVGAFLLAGAVLIAWVFQQRHSKAPLISFRDMDVRQAVIGYVALFVAAFVAQGLFLALPVLLQSGHALGMSTLESTYFQLALIPGAAAGYLWTRFGLQYLGPKLVLVISGIGAVLLYCGFGLVHQPAWIFYVYVFIYGLTVLSFITVGMTLVAASGRQDNMAVTVGMQSIVQSVTVMGAVAIVLNILTPGADGVVPLDTFVGLYLGLAAFIAVFVVVWAIFAPRRISDLHAIDTEDKRRVTMAQESAGDPLTPTH